MPQFPNPLLAFFHNQSDVSTNVPAGSIHMAGHRTTKVTAAAARATSQATAVCPAHAFSRGQRCQSLGFWATQARSANPSMAGGTSSPMVMVETARPQNRPLSNSHLLRRSLIHKSQVTIDRNMNSARGTDMCTRRE